MFSVTFSHIKVVFPPWHLLSRAFGEFLWVRLKSFSGISFTLLLRLIRNSIGKFPTSIWFAVVQKFMGTSISISVVAHSPLSFDFIISYFSVRKLSLRTSWTAYHIHFWFQEKMSILRLLNIIHFQFWFHFCANIRIQFRMPLSLLLIILIWFIQCLSFRGLGDLLHSLQQIQFVQLAKTN